MLDSYKIFFERFNIEEKDIINFGLEEAIFIPPSKVATEWEALKSNIYQGDGQVYIRGYGRDAKGTSLYLELYSNLFGHGNFVKDPTNNAEPARIIRNLTGFARGSGSEKNYKRIQNYQVSHVFGRTKNPFAFAAPWNIVYLPKIVDPFTGHESRGNLSRDFQNAFKQYVYQKYESYIKEFNSIMNEINPVLNKHLENIEGTSQFLNDITSQFQIINLSESIEIGHEME